MTSPGRGRWMRRIGLARLPLVVLALSVPHVAAAQVDLDGNKLATQVGVGSDDYSDSHDRQANVGHVAVTQRLNDRFTVEGTANAGVYYGAGFVGAGGGLTWKPTPKSYVLGSFLRNSSTPTTYGWVMTIEGGALVYKGTGVIKALEADYAQTWKGYDASLQTSVVVYTPGVVIYLPKGYELTVHTGAVALVEFGVRTVTPSGGARLRVPVTPRVSVTASISADSEGTASVTPPFSLSTRSYGGGVKVWLSQTTSIEGFAVASHYTTIRLTAVNYGALLLKRF
jgi:hypothetical protein